jgi:hypothetical protein
MIAPDLFLTNWHCGGRAATPSARYFDSEVRANAVVDLGWDDGPVRRQYNVIAVVRANKDLDYAILRVAPTLGSGAAVGPATPVEVSFTPPSTQDQVFVVHHARCMTKRVSAGCSVRGTASPWTKPGAPPTEFAHDCDTEPGASGAPVFNSSGQMVALHHLGFNAGNACVARDGLNKAIQLSAIAGDIHDNDAALWGHLGWPKP